MPGFQERGPASEWALEMPPTPRFPSSPGPLPPGTTQLPGALSPSGLWHVLWGAGASGKAASAPSICPVSSGIDARAFSCSVRVKCLFRVCGLGGWFCLHLTSRSSVGDPRTRGESRTGGGVFPSGKRPNVPRLLQRRVRPPRAATALSPERSEAPPRGGTSPEQLGSGLPYDGGRPVAGAG